MTMKTGHDAVDSMVDRLHGPDAVAGPHLHGMRKESSLRKGRVRNEERNLVKERRGGDLLAAGADRDTGKFACSWRYW